MGWNTADGTSAMCPSASTQIRNMPRHMECSCRRPEAGLRIDRAVGQATAARPASSWLFVSGNAGSNGAGERGGDRGGLWDINLSESADRRMASPLPPPAPLAASWLALKQHLAAVRGRMQGPL